MKKRPRKWLIIVTFILLILAGTFYGLIQRMNQRLDALQDIEWPSIDLASIEDGEYQGDYRVFPIEVEVLVTIDNHQITAIEITKHVQGQGAAAESVIDEVIDTNSLSVDWISGATYSSIVILKAIEDALLQADAS